MGVGLMKIYTKVTHESVGPLLEKMENETGVRWITRRNPTSINTKLLYDISALICRSDPWGRCELTYLARDMDDQPRDEQLVTPDRFVEMVAQECPKEASDEN